ncbi:MAG: sigma-54-dependent Fis family transcriptional regulator, partial [Flavobacteriales bacterium]|nr:sigma-54-dependent Fis family transcriptional regulator [Flavobacteriales bacterium]
RVLETGEFIKVGSSKVQKTDVRVVAATNIDFYKAIQKGKFREDLFYRLNTVPIHLPPLRERKEDIHLLFRKFAADFAAKYRMPSVQLSQDAVNVLTNFSWPGNIRQLKNVAEQVSVIESSRTIDAETISKYLPKEHQKSNLPTLYNGSDKADLSEREILYKVLFDLKSDVTELKKLVFNILSNQDNNTDSEKNAALVKSIQQLYAKTEEVTQPIVEQEEVYKPQIIPSDSYTHHEEVEEESLSLADKEKEMIKKALEKYNGRRKNAATELGISERTLYRKIKEYKIED